MEKIIQKIIVFYLKSDGFLKQFGDINRTNLVILFQSKQKSKRGARNIRENIFEILLNSILQKKVPWQKNG